MTPEARDFGAAYADETNGDNSGTSCTIRRPTRERVFYGAMALTILLTVFVGFAPTYYLLDDFSRVTSLVHLHAAVFSAWVLMLLTQTALVATGPVRLHRRLGIVGVALAALLLGVGTATTIAVARRISGPPHFVPPGDRWSLWSTSSRSDPRPD